MRLVRILVGAFALTMLTRETEGTIMLGSLLMALKGGLFATKMGVGGLLAMALAGTQTGQNLNALSGLTTTTYGAPHKRSSRSVETAAEAPLPINVTGTANETEIVEKIAHNLNNISSPLTRRMMRQIAVLDQLSCLPKFICGLNTRTPSKQTSAINDYGFLIKYLFERDDDDNEQDDAGEQDEEEDEELSRTDVNKDLTEKTKDQAKKHPLSEDEEDSSDSAEDNTDPEKLSDQDDEQLEDAAQDELVEDEPEMMLYAMADMRNQFQRPRIPGINKNYGVDHSDFPGYKQEDYLYRKNPLLNTDSATAILRQKSRLPPSPYDKGWDGDLDFKEERRPGLFTSILPAFLSYKRKKISLTKGSSSGGDDPFANDPFFDGFRRRSLPLSKVKAAIGDQAEDIRKDFMMQRRNSRFANPLSFFQKKRQELKTSSDPLKPYEIAEEVGQKTKNSRQCRMLFARCPYTYDEITTMIGNVKKLVSAQATVGDKVVALQKNEASAASSVVDTTTTTSSGGQAGSKLSLKKNTGTTQISHQMNNGHKVEILLSIQPKEEEISVSHIPPTPDPELLKANKTLQDMRKALQTIAKLHNQTDLDLHDFKEKTQQSLAQLAEVTQEDFTTFATTLPPPSLEQVTTEGTTPGPVIHIPVTKISRRPPAPADAEQEDDADDDGDGDNEDDDDDDEDADDDEENDDSQPPPPPPPVEGPPVDDGPPHYYRNNAPGPSNQANSTPQILTDALTSATSEENEDSTDPSSLPKVTIRPAQVSRVRPPVSLPPLPSPYKIIKKKNPGNKSQEVTDMPTA